MNFIQIDAKPATVISNFVRVVKATRLKKALLSFEHHIRQGPELIYGNTALKKLTFLLRYGAPGILFSSLIVVTNGTLEKGI
jgi:hypothetical protein